MGELTVGVDVGGTKIQSVIGRSENIVGQHRLETPQSGADDVAAAIVEAATKALAEADAEPTDVRALGLGVPGAIDTDAGTVSSSPNLPGFQDPDPVPLAEMVSSGLGGVPVKLDNDVRVGILGEWKRGAGRGYRHLLGVWVGTGVGGGLVLDGELFQGRGAAGEIGHTIVKPGGRVCGCGRVGHLEAYAGRASMEAEARRRVKKGHKTDLFDIMKKKGRSRLSSGVWASALEHHDKMARDLIDDAVEALATGIASAQNLLALEAIVIGGGLGDRLGAPFVERIQQGMKPLLFVPDAAPKMLATEFGDLSGAVGASVLAGG
ncbi:MAG TPA: ROK family protein [Actinomycetota bacterium]|nr:ROK family protein [Actinomycetota bacterium]